jgi:hypothetical protein
MHENHVLKLLYQYKLKDPRDVKQKDGNSFDPCNQNHPRA